MNQKEAFSRVIIDRRLREAGWDIENEHQVIFEDHGTAGRSDYVLKDRNNHPVAIIEAKKPDLDPYNAKQQAYDYVRLQYPSVDYVYLANDNVIYLWDLGEKGGDAKLVPAFFSQEDLERKRSAGRIGNVEALSQREVTPEYFDETSPGYKFRPYQIEAWQSIAEQYDAGRRSFLLEMATGTGKTVLSALIISRFLHTNNASNVLFIVDRKSLALQTKQKFEQLLHGSFAVGTYWGSNRKNLTGANVVVATIQSLALHGREHFTPGYFDLIIHDEAHRSIYSPEARSAVDRFIGATKIGLTATPKDFLKNVEAESLAINDPRRLERRLQRDTYKYFECESGVPTFRYTIQDGVRDHYLTPPKQHKMSTLLTQASLSDGGITELDDVELEEGTSLKITDLEKKVSLPERNRSMMQEFIDHGNTTPDGEFGKTLVFAVSQRHATELEKVLNLLMPQYNGRFAQTITSNVSGAHELAKEFAKESVRLPRVAITVDMLSTGFDAPEVQNIVLARPVFDPTTYQQIKGRGTRLCPEIDKKYFTIYDFCGVVEYFDERYDWEAPLADPSARDEKLEAVSTETGRPIVRGSITDHTEEDGRPTEPIVSQTRDTVATRDLIEIGPDGDKVDREMYQDRWTKAVHEFAGSNKELLTELLGTPEREEELIELMNVELLNKPKEYFNEESLSSTYRIIAGVKDFLMAALGHKDLPSREQQFEDFKQGLISKFETEGEPSQRKTLMIRTLADRLYQDDRLRNKVEVQVSSLQKPVFLQEPVFQQAFSISEWLNEFESDELVELANDITSSRLVRL